MAAMAPKECRRQGTRGRMAGMLNFPLCGLISTA
jgi:hypothetical protein